MNKQRMVLILIAFLFSTLFFMGCSPAEIDDQAEADLFSIDDLSGEVVTLIVPHSSGGGYDNYARLIAPFIEKHTGATVIVENITGAAGVVGRNALWNAEADGFTIGITAFSSIIMNEILKLEAAEYRAADFNYLARITGEPTLIIASATENIRSVEDLLQMELVKFGEPSVVDDTYFNTMVFASDHGINILPVTGYEGTSELMLALFRNEFDIMNRSVSNLIDYINAGEVVPIVLNGLERSVLLPDVPTMIELAAGEEQTSHALLFATMVENSRGFLAPPAMSQDIIETWQEILRLVLTDQELLEIAAASNLPIDYLHGDEISILLLEAIAMGESIKPLIKQLAEEAE